MERDVIIVLAGGINPDGSLPNITKYRVEKGVELYKQEVAPFLLMSGSWSFMLNYIPPITEAKAMGDYAVKLGVPKDRILLEEKFQKSFGI
jgi:vancomycin permeability regulator SanA